MVINLLLCKLDWTDPTLIAGIISVIGTLLGTFAGYFLSQWSKRGSINFLCNKIDLRYNFEPDKETLDRHHNTIEYKGQIAKSTSLYFELYLLNSSEIQFSINNAELIVKYKKVIHRSNLYAELNANNPGKDYGTILLKGKESMRISAHSTLNAPIDKNELAEMKFYVKFIDVNGNTKCKKIKTSKKLIIRII